MTHKEKYEREHEHHGRRISMKSKVGDFLANNKMTGLGLLQNQHSCGCMKRRIK